MTVLQPLQTWIFNSGKMHTTSEWNVQLPFKRIKETTLTSILFSPQLEHMTSTSSSYQRNMIKHVSTNHWRGFYSSNSPTPMVVVVEVNTLLALASQVRQKWTEATAKSPKQGHAPWQQNPSDIPLNTDRDPKKLAYYSICIYIYIYTAG